MHLFNGNPRRATFVGESTGGCVMLQLMAYEVTLGKSLFENGIAPTFYL